MSTSATFGYLCVIAGFLVIVASVVFVIKGKAVLSDTGAPNVVAWGKMKANLTSAVALFALGAAMIVVPFWRFQQEEASQQAALDSQPPTALLTGDISGPGGKMSGCCWWPNPITIRPTMATLRGRFRCSRVARLIR